MNAEIAAGRYGSGNEVMSQALRDWELAQARRDLELESLRQDVAIGLGDVDSGTEMPFCPARIVAAGERLAAKNR